MGRVSIGGGLRIASMIMITVTGCQTSPTTPPVYMSSVAADGTSIRVLAANIASISDVDPGPGVVWDDPSQPNVTGSTGISDIDHRAVEQSGAEIVNEETGAVLCAGTGSPDDSLQIDNYWVPGFDVHMALSLHCDDPRDSATDLSLPTTGRIDFGGYGAI